MLRLRAAEKDDSAEILQLIGELADYEKLRSEVVATRTDIEAALFGPEPRVFCTVAEWRPTETPGTDSQPVDASPAIAGFALWFYNFSTFKGRHGIYLEDLFVRPPFRGLGIGKALLQSLAQRCVREQLTRLEWSVLDWNQPARDFYLSLGADALTEWVPHRLSGAALQHLGVRATHESPSPPQP